jgi:hypothetical protein
MMSIVPIKACHAVIFSRRATMYMLTGTPARSTRQTWMQCQTNDVVSSESL